MKSPEEYATILSAEIRRCIGKHMTNFDATELIQMVGTTLIALYTETAHLKTMAIKSGEINADEFDNLFAEGLEKKYEESKTRDRSH